AHGIAEDDAPGEIRPAARDLDVPLRQRVAGVEKESLIRDPDLSPCRDRHRPGRADHGAVALAEAQRHGPGVGLEVDDRERGPEGAAAHDVLRRAECRGPGARVLAVVPLDVGAADVLATNQY